MIWDSYDNKFDIILVMSISRFARNAAHLLEKVNKLRGLGIEVVFEQENIITSDHRQDLLIAVHTAMAQAEGESLSEAIKWGLRRGFETGESKTAYKSEDVEKSILQGQRKWLTINENENISVYLYENKEKMEKDSSYLSKDGFSYDDGKEIKSIDWTSYPHFFKKDNMIVLYVGENPEIINLLKEVMDSQFSGETKEDLSDRRPMVMINGEIYLDTNRESDLNGRCGVMDGEISSTVDATEIPTQDNQSNFGDGYEYQYVGQNSIDIYMNGKWIRFEKEITDVWGIQLDTSKPEGTL